MTRLAAASLWALASLGCGGTEPLTEILVAVDTDMDVPAELDSVRIDVIGPAGDVRRANGAVAGAGSLPVVLGIAHRGGPLGPVRITVTGRLAGADVVQRHAVVEFVPERVLVLRLWLHRRCIGETCDPAETCSAGSCRDQRVEPRELEEWTGSIGRLDAGPPQADAGPDAGGDACVAAAETCNEADDDCDGDIDEVFDLMRDPLNCGSCGNACPADPPNGAGVCVGGDCTVLCDPDWADCSGAGEDDGCETPLSEASSCGACEDTCDGATPICAQVGGTWECVGSCDTPLIGCGGACVDTSASPRHCGACDASCTAPTRAAATCTASACGLACDTGFADCDMDAGNGCESTLRELAHCGACGAACAPANAVASCATQTCEIVACEGTSADCNGASSDGCETNVATSLASCGRCGNACPADPSNAVARCVEGRCRLTCDPGFADCNRVLDDGCEASLGSAATCGSCGIRCDGTSPSCTGSAEDGYTCAASCGAGASVLCSGSCVDPSDDPLHCGACGAACPERPRSSRQCVSSECEYRCDPGWEDCNDDVARDGCEARLGSVSHCGGCDVRCRLQNATPRCDMGACAIATCESGFADCNGLPSDGCEASAPCS